ncbi:uncharacterized protein PV07_06638 [Cladophialophora immunda]|uniref:NAD(P)-binding protein n=1 Tax=Cladophialophora immunda TaxID=569365 RepID=A0A0D2C8M5_9EURO|nr:uncharacterized protein PV07_06638 [Cladophialophora immunda]KIW26835.1 hypothetical protein PV07_06638 [Cladophialophora immunda]OQV08209.1 hypothetical protein CLAIMM_12519 [Cladophialophora immunda]
MTVTTHAHYDERTEALEVAKAFAEAIKGKTILVTGVNRQGVGFTTAQAFASQSPAHLIVAGRSASKLQECIDELERQYPNVEYRALILDLASQKAVRKAAEEVLSWSDIPTIDILVNNAGIMNMGLAERELSDDGLEIHFATNHVGHFLFTNLVMPKLLQAAGTNPKGSTRIVQVSSGAAESGGIRWSDINFEKTSKDLPPEEQPDYAICRRWGIPDAPDRSFVPLMAYVQSKAANVLFGVSLTEKLYHAHGILSLAVHPGVIATELGRYNTKEQIDSIHKRAQAGRFHFKTQGAGASTSLVAATDPELGPSEASGHGAFLKNCQLADAHPRAQAPAEAEKLWKLSEELVGQRFSY